MWTKLANKDVKGLPTLGQVQGDFKTFDDVLANATGKHTSVAQFLFESTHSLREKGHGRAADKYGVSDMHAKVKRDIDVCEWDPSMTFSHLLLPCGIADVSSNPVKCITRLCFPFLQTPRGPDPGGAITSLCGLTWLLAYVLEKELVARARLCRVSQKMRITEDDGDLWFNKVASLIDLQQPSRLTARAPSTCMLEEVPWTTSSPFSLEVLSLYAKIGDGLH